MRHGVVAACRRAGQCSSRSGLSGPQRLQVVVGDPPQRQQGRGLPAGQGVAELRQKMCVFPVFRKNSPRETAARQSARNPSAGGKDPPPSVG